MIGNLYVIWRMNRRHIVVTGVAFAIASSAERESPVGCGRGLARYGAAGVHVYGKSGAIEDVNSYPGGVERRHSGRAYRDVP